ncbi:MAG TPA: trypsin-like serine protease [Anaerolineae bacterium]|nr:trypsin-like serine protease [Anaerolineae bacterium]
MKPTTKTFLLPILLPLASIIVLSTLYTQTFAQDISTPEVFAVSSWGDKLDFKTLASETAMLYDNQAFSEKLIPPRIPENMQVMESFFTPNVIIGDDDRLKVTDTTNFPWSTVVKIHGNFGAFSFNCSGWMLGPSTVATSAHCIYDYGDTNTYATNVIVTPAMNSDSPNSEPFGHCEAYKAWIINLWETIGDPKYDYGVYMLRCRVGEQTGNLGYRVMTDEQIDEALTNVTGYPLDKGGTTMWFGMGNVLETPADFLLYDNDTTGGQSGAPVWELIDDACQVCVVATHRSGIDDHNTGVRITNDVFDFLFVMQQRVYHSIYIPVVLKNAG